MQRTFHVNHLAQIIPTTRATATALHLRELLMGRKINREACACADLAHNIQKAIVTFYDALNG